MTINQRIKVLLVSQNVDEKKIHTEINMSSRMVKNYIDEDKVPNYNFLKWLFTQFKQLNPQWLFNGEDPMFLPALAVDKKEGLAQRVIAVEKELGKLKALLDRTDERLATIEKNTDVALEVINKGLEKE